MTAMLGPLLPAEVLAIIREQMFEIADSDDTALLSFGLLAALWSSSAAMGAIVHAMNRACDIDDQRPWWRVRLLAMVLTIGLALFILVSLTLVLAGPQLADLATAGWGCPLQWFGAARPDGK